MSEPFNMTNLVPTIPKFDSSPYGLGFRVRQSALVQPELWQSLQDQMQDSDTATKIFGRHIWAFRPAVLWWQRCQQQDSFDIFVLQRDRLETCMSFVLAEAFGYEDAHRFDHVEVSIPASVLVQLDLTIEAHIKHFPTCGRLISWPNLPESHFDTTLSIGRAVNQKSIQLKNLIANYSYIEHRVREILEWHRQDWDDRENAMQAQGDMTCKVSN